ncbi:YceH family protein [uncultured Rhodoferax sp.]|uniref:YceH family protein n=1 Tax=uncultured Rhodoferax sp. TaxID=223188 RepID=UPI0025F7C6FF|nr:YceH family protein [uncultured Rhodoferax sp.]
MTTPLLLTPVEARVLATLMEKARTVPDSYPLTLNSLLLGCNQKTSREPLMELSESEVSSAVNTLREAGLVHETSGGRATKFTHNAQRGIGVPEQSAVLLGLLMLRGPQTAAELRLNAERWYRFADTSSVEAFLDEMQERSEEKGGPLVIKLDRAPGAREQRWAHLLCGPVDASAAATARSAAPASSELQARVTQLEAEVASLRATVELLCKELGLSQPGQKE